MAATATASPLFTTMNSSVPRTEPTVTLAEMRRRTHFERLCVPPNCTRKDVVAAYRRFALVYHPDKNRHEDAAEIFKLLGESHKAILNDEARIAYQIQLQQSSRGNPYTPDPRISNAEAALKRAFTSSGAHMWGRANTGAATKAQPPKKPKPNPQRYIVPIDLEAMDAGKKIPYDYKKITTSLHGDTERLLTAIIDVPLGATDGEKITLESQGNCYFGMSAADLVFLLQQRPHPLFTRRIGADLFIERRIDPLEMLTGVAFEFKTVYGEIVEAHCEPPLSQNQMIRIPGVGMRKRGLAHGGPDDERGDVVVCIRVVVADAAKLSREDVEGIQRIIKKRKTYFFLYIFNVFICIKMNAVDNAPTTERVPSVGRNEAQPTADASVPTEKTPEAASARTEEKQECEKIDSLNDLVSSMKIKPPAPPQPTPDEPRNENHDKRARFASVVANRVFFHLATSVLENQPVLSFLQHQYRIFELLPNTDGVWFVVMTVESAVRFLNGIEQELFRGNIVNRFFTDAEALAREETKTAALFNWKESVFYATADYIRRFEDAKTIFEATVGHAKLSDDVATMRADFYERYRVLTIMQPEDLEESVACMTRRDTSRQIAVNLMVVDPAYDLCGSHVFKYDVALTASDRLLYLKHLAVRYMITMRDTELILAHESGAKTPMSREESREVRNAVLSYATAVLYENEFVNPEDLGSDIGLMSRACTAPVAICGYCAKRCSNDVRCKRCFLFRYCSHECMTRHLTDGVEGTRETAAPGSLVVTHAHLCGLSRALGVFWTQFPPDLDQLDFARITNASQKTFSEFALNPENTKVEFEEIQPPASEEKPATVQS